MRLASGLPDRIVKFGRRAKHHGWLTRGSSGRFRCHVVMDVAHLEFERVGGEMFRLDPLIDDVERVGNHASAVVGGRLGTETDHPQLIARQFEQKWAGDRHPPLAPKFAILAQAELQLFLGARHADE